MRRRSFLATLAAWFTPKPTTTLTAASPEDWQRYGTIRMTEYIQVSEHLPAHSYIFIGQDGIYKFSTGYHLRISSPPKPASES